MATEKCPVPFEAIETSTHDHDSKFPLKENLSFTEGEGVVENQNVVEFGEKDPENPTEWPLWRKWSIVMLVATMFMLTYVFIPTSLSSVNQVLPRKS